MSHTSIPVGSPSRLPPRTLGVSGGVVGHPESVEANGIGNTASQVTRNSNALPPLATLTADAGQTTSTSPTAFRSTGLHSLLNPPDTTAPDRQRAVSAVAPRTGLGHTPILPPSYGSPRGRKRGESHSPGTDQDQTSSSRNARRILTPRSPGLRAASLGAHRSPSTAPGLPPPTSVHGREGRGYMVEPGNSTDAAVPPLPPLPVTRAPFPAIRTGEPGHYDTRQPPVNPPPYTGSYVRPTSSGPVGPQSASYGQPRSTSPTTYPPGTPLVNPTMPRSDSRPGFPGLLGSASGQSTPRFSSGWKMNIDTETGPEVVDINIDFQQASKVADEKRRRNAGASARFRARRKEKEKESSQMISGLQQDLRELAEARDFYRAERDFLRELFLRSKVGPLPARPPSPRTRRPPSMPHAASENGLDYGHRDSLDASVQRHHANDYQPSFAPSPNPSVYNNPYSLEARTQSVNPPPPPMALARPQEIDPFRRDIDRWNSSRP